MNWADLGIVVGTGEGKRRKRAFQAEEAAKVAAEGKSCLRN